MCIVSNIGDSYKDNWPDRWPGIPINPVPPFPMTPSPNPFPYGTYTIDTSKVSQEDFDKLKAEVQELRKLLEAAIEFDKKTGQPDCQMDEKVAFIKEVARFVGVDLSKIFK